MFAIQSSIVQDGYTEYYLYTDNQPYCTGRSLLWPDTETAA